MLQTYLIPHWNDHFSDSTQQHAIRDLESGDILYFPKLSFALTDTEKKFLTPTYADPKSKNIGYSVDKKKLWGVKNLEETDKELLASMLDRFAHCAADLIKAILPRYTPQLTMARTSFRPVQISGRPTSYRKDDTRLHVDAFPSSPNQGKRILRVFCNINPNGEDRIWRTGEPFEKVAQQFIPRISAPIPGFANLLNILGITKTYRTAYDHYMLKMHDAMKANEQYQKNADQHEVRFPPGSTWIVQTDHVSHAAMSGQYLLEQTFYLPVKAMQDESKSPLRILEKLLQKKLV